MGHEVCCLVPSTAKIPYYPTNARSIESDKWGTIQSLSHHDLVGNEEIGLVNMVPSTAPNSWRVEAGNSAAIAEGVLVITSDAHRKEKVRNASQFMGENLAWPMAAASMLTALSKQASDDI